MGRRMGFVLCKGLATGARMDAILKMCLETAVPTMAPWLLLIQYLCWSLKSISRDWPSNLATSAEVGTISRLRTGASSRYDVSREPRRRAGADLAPRA